MAPLRTSIPVIRDQDGTETVQAFTCAPGCPVAGLDAQSGNVRSSGKYVKGTHGIDPAGGTRGAAPFGNDGSTAPTYGDAGGASRFFLHSPGHRSTICRSCIRRRHRRKNALSSRDCRASYSQAAGADALAGPADHASWGLILDPFAGTGTTIQAALLEGFRVIGIDDDGDSIARIRVRLADYEVKYA